MLAPVLACRLVRQSKICPVSALIELPKVLDLRERGSQTVTHSEGTFTTKPPITFRVANSNSSPDISPRQNAKPSRTFGQTYPRVGGVTNTVGSNVMTSFGSILPELDQEEDEGLELDDMSSGFGLGLGGFLRRKGSNKTMQTGAESMEASTLDVTSPAPAYHALELGLGASQTQNISLNGAGGIRVDVEKHVGCL